MGGHYRRAEDRVGTVVANRFRIVRLVATGGMGTVYEAENVRTAQRLAVKFMHHEGDDPQLSKRFLREARAACAVVHPNVVSVIDIDIDATDGSPFIVAEYLDGEDLRRTIDRRGALSPREVVAIAIPLMEALVAAHASGVIHRDIKPANVFLARGSGGATVPKLIDFGVAKIEQPANASQPTPVTKSGESIGTPAYMSPEQARGSSDADAQSDVWAIGVVLFEALTGKNPFARGNAMAALASLIADPIPQLAVVAPDVPRDLAAIVQRALERSRVDRYQSMREFRDALASWHAEPAAVVGSPPRRAQTSGNRSLRTALIASCAVLLSVAIGIGVRSRVRHAEATSSPRTAEPARSPAPIATLPARPLAVPAVVASTSPPIAPIEPRTETTPSATTPQTPPVRPNGPRSTRAPHVPANEPPRDAVASSTPSATSIGSNNSPVLGL